MGGGNSKPTEAEKAQVLNEVTSNINTQISNLTKNISNTINQTMNSVTNTQIANNTADTYNSGGATNIFTSSGIIACTVNIDQQATINSQVQAALAITQDTKQLQDMAQTMKQNLDNKVRNGTELNNKITQTSALNNLKSNDKGIGDIVNSVLDAALALSNKNNGAIPSDSDVKSIINNQINMTISNTTINQTDIKNIMDNHFATNITFNNALDCKSVLNASNLVAIAGCTPDGYIQGNQKSVANGLTTCMYSAMKIDNLVNKLTSVASTDNTNTNDNTIKSTQDSTASSDTSNIKKTSDNTIKDLGGAIATAAQGLGSGISTAYEGVGSGVSTAVQGAGSGVSTAVQGVGTGAGNILNEAGGALAKNNPFTQFGSSIAILFFVFGLCCIGGFVFNQMNSKNNNESENGGEWDENGKGNNSKSSYGNKSGNERNHSYHDKRWPGNAQDSRWHGNKSGNERNHSYRDGSWPGDAEDSWWPGDAEDSRWPGDDSWPGDTEDSRGRGDNSSDSWGNGKRSWGGQLGGDKFIQGYNLYNKILKLLSFLDINLLLLIIFILLHIYFLM